MAFHEVTEGQRLPSGWVFGAWYIRGNTTYLGFRVPSFRKTTQYHHGYMDDIHDYHDHTFCVRVRHDKPTPSLQFAYWRQLRSR